MTQEEIKIFDGDDEIIFSESFNIYEEQLKINNFLGFNFAFVFEKEFSDNKKDILVDIKDKNIKIVLSKKFRNSIGSMSSEKIAFLQKDKEKILFSIFGQQIGKETLHITINFYRR
jgi:hypothetical protein